MTGGVPKISVVTPSSPSTLLDLVNFFHTKDTKAQSFLNQYYLF